MLVRVFEVEYTDEFEAWWGTLSEAQQEAIAQRVVRLEALGPSLRRPHVGEIKGSKHDPQMKELICECGGSLRILFVFNPLRNAILLLGGDKSGQWNRWYQTAIPAADNLYDAHLQELSNEGKL
jgi:hypothetical protein